MPRKLKFIDSRVLLLATIVAVARMLAPRPTQAQADSWTPPYPMILTAQRALAFVQAADQKLDYVPGEVLVKFKDGVTTAGQQRALMALRSGPDVSELRWVGDVAVFTDQRELDATILAAQLSAQPEIAYAEPNYLLRKMSTPNDPSFALRQWNFSAIDLPRAWDVNAGSNASVIIAVVDFGITNVNQSFTFPTWDGGAIRSVSVPFAINPDLQASRLVSGRDFTFWNGPVLDMDSHGTHVSGTIGEDTNNGLAEAGIAYHARIMPVKVCLGYWDLQFTLSASGFRGFVPQNVAGCDTATVAQGIRYAADNGAKVINISLGGPGASLTQRDALSYAVGRGAFIAIAMGNEFLDGNPTDYPAAYARDIDGVMSVGAVGRTLKRAYYSNTGAHLEISAPGGDDSDGAAGELWQATISPLDSDSRTIFFPRFDRYVEKAEEGTSMASPHVAGIAALIMSQGVTNPAAVEALIKATARDLGAPGRDDLYGYGLIQPRVALRGVGVK